MGYWNIRENVFILLLSLEKAGFFVALLKNEKFFTAKLKVLPFCPKSFLQKINPRNIVL